MLNTRTLLPQETRGLAVALASKTKFQTSTMHVATPLFSGKLSSSRSSLSKTQREISCFVSKGKSHNAAARHQKPSSGTSTSSSSSSAPSKNTSQEASKPTDLDHLVRRRYFDDLFTGGDYTLASKILDPEIIHRDMVRDEQYSGVDEVVEYMRQVKEAYPSFLVRATEIAASPDGNSMFVSFEGHAAEGMPLFRGIDKIYFTDNGNGEKKIKEVDVYRSNWQGAKGHSQRKMEMEEQLRREEREAEEKRQHKKKH
jgi:hypothetical protein